jgi:hypothetical protein
MKISDVLDQIGKDVLTDDSKKALTEAFEDAVKVSVEERVKLDVDNSLKQLDEQHAQKLEQLLGTIDEDHTKKLVAVLEKVDKDHAGKLQFVIERYKKIMTEDAKEFKAQLVESVSNFIELYIKDALPKQEIAEAVKNVQARKIVEQVKQIVSLDEEFINSTVKEAVADGKNTIDTLRGELNEAVKMNIKLAQESKNAKAELVLEKQAANLPKEKKDYVMRALKGKDPEFITENFDYVIKMFEEDENKATRLVTEDAKKKSRVVTEKLDVPASQIKDESLVNEQADQEPVNEYLNVLKSQDNKFGK